MRSSDQIINWNKAVYVLHLMLFCITGCAFNRDPAPLATPDLSLIPTVADAISLGEIPTETATSPLLPATWTPDPRTPLVATPVGEFLFTPLPTNTLFATLSPTPSRTATATATPPPTLIPTSQPPPTAVPLPTDASGAVVRPNILQNPSFEEGWYHHNGDQELQIPNEWRFEFVEGENDLDPDPWNKWVRPEVRVLPREFLPPHEHDTFIWDGNHTVKVFKGEGAINVRLLTTQNLPPGTYRFSVEIYPDLVVDYTASGGKIFADDFMAGEVQFLVDGSQTNWEFPTFGRRNSLSYTFINTEEHPVTLGIGIRGRWAILNNGWFMDDWRLEKLD